MPSLIRIFIFVLLYFPCLIYAGEHSERRSALYVFAPSIHDEAYKVQTRNLQHARQDFAGRGIEIWEVFSHGLVRLMDDHSQEYTCAQDLYDAYAVFSSRFTLLLLNEKGEVTLRLLQPLPAQAIFVYLDAAPIRQEALRSKNNKV